jgi:hypothetical protein
MPVNILPFVEVYTATPQTVSDHLAKSKLIETIYTGFNGYATKLRTIFGNSQKLIPWDKLRGLI